MGPGEVNRGNARQMVNLVRVHFAYHGPNPFRITDVYLVILHSRFSDRGTAGREYRNLRISRFEEPDQVCSDKPSSTGDENAQSFTLSQFIPSKREVDRSQ